MPTGARVCLGAGLLILVLTVVNAVTAAQITPDLQRAEVLSGLAAVGMMLVAALWTQANPVSAGKQPLEGQQGFVIADGLAELCRDELAWGSHLLLTATPAATVLVYWDQAVISRRGVLGSGDFAPGPICERAQRSGELVSLLKVSLFPGRGEFDSIVENLPSVMIYPLNSRGWVIVGGWSERCFSRSDERWFVGWCERLRNSLENGSAL
ncbi:MAG: cofactor assembly of complex C subunit B [Prochlorococcus sp.]|nr:cofactor assembly of complex C subunit B [Prochlorococcaceae cyanobacterium Fu_MAG_50]